MHTKKFPCAGILMAAILAGPLLSAATAHAQGPAYLVKDINSTGPAGVPAQDLANADGTLFFVPHAGTADCELWRSDGTAAGTLRVKAFARQPNCPSPKALASVNGTLFFAESGEQLPFNGTRLWRSDGTAAGTAPVKDLPGVSPLGPTNVGGTLFFLTLDGSSGLADLWRSDGTDAGTFSVKHLFAHQYLFDAPQLTNVNGMLFFVLAFVANGEYRTELWRSDGTPAGTVRLTESATLANLTAVNGTLFFTADNATHSEPALWTSDGTQAGTVPVKHFNGASFAQPPSFLTNAGGTLFFTAYHDNGFALWKSDGTEAGTTPIKDVAAVNLTSVNTNLFFTDRSTELWRSDGSEAGTVPVKSF